MLFYKRLAICLLVCISAVSANAQKITFKDIVTGNVIEGVSFTTESAKGSSNKAGAITLKEGTKHITCTHILYEPIHIMEKQLADAVRNGIILLTPKAAFQLNPVTVYGIKNTSIHHQSKLSIADWVQHDAGQVLQQVPGFAAVRKSTAYAADPVFRGFKHDQVLVLTNGCLSTLTACPSRMDPPSSQVLISQASDVQVVKGPHSFRFGPTTGAVVNFRLPDAVFSTAGVKYFGRVSAGFESNGEIYRTESSIGLRAKNISVKATGAYSIGHDYKDGYDSIIPAHFRRGSIGLNADYKINESNIISASASRNFTRDTDFPTLMMDQTKDDTWMLQAQYKNMPVNKWYKRWNTQLYHTSVDHVMSNIYRPSVMMKMTTLGHTKTVGARTEMEVTQEGNQYVFGADVKSEWMADTLWQNAEVKRGGIFADGTIKLEKYKLSFAGRADIVSGAADYPLKKFVTIYSDLSRTDFNFSASVGIQRSWSKVWQTGLWFGRGLRSASVSERYLNSYPVGLDTYEIFGNPQLKPEANNQADLIVSFRQKNTELIYTAFYSIASNYIYAVINPAIPKKNMASPGVRQYINLNKATRYGFEFSWRQNWNKYLQQYLTASYTRGKNNDAGTPLAEIAPFELRYNLTASLLQQKFYPFVQLRYSAPQKKVAADYGERTTDAFTIADLGLRYAPYKNFQITCSVNNIFDTRYREPLSRYISKTKALTAPGRSLIAMATYTF